MPGLQPAHEVGSLPFHYISLYTKIYMCRGGEAKGKPRTPHKAIAARLRKQLAKHKLAAERANKKLAELTTPIPLAGRDEDEVYAERKKRFVILLCGRRQALFNNVLTELVMRTVSVFEVRPPCCTLPHPHLNCGQHFEGFFSKRTLNKIHTEQQALLGGEFVLEAAANQFSQQKPMTRRQGQLGRR